MIRSWENGSTRRFAEVGKSKFSGMNVDVAEKRLAALEAATSLADLTPLRAIGLHKLAGAPKDQWAVNVNGHGASAFASRMATCGMLKLSTITDGARR
jgi:proteic killer suppression protein